jgi:hypothetical protein
MLDTRPDSERARRLITRLTAMRPAPGADAARPPMCHSKAKTWPRDTEVILFFAWWNVSCYWLSAGSIAGFVDEAGQEPP